MRCLSGSNCDFLLAPLLDNVSTHDRVFDGMENESQSKSKRSEWLLSSSLRLINDPLLYLSTEVDVIDLVRRECLSSPDDSFSKIWMDNKQPQL